MFVLRLEASVWAHSNERDGEIVMQYSTKITRSRKKGNTWEDTHYFYTNDLPKILIVAQEAYKYIELKHGEGTNNKNFENGGES